MKLTRSIPFMVQYGECALPEGAVPKFKRTKRTRTDTRSSKVRMRTRRDFNRAPAQYRGERPWAVSPTGK